MNELLEYTLPVNVYLYLACCFGGALLVRIINRFFLTLEQGDTYNLKEIDQKIEFFKDTMLWKNPSSNEGLNPDVRYRSDNLTGLIIGSCELFLLPIFMVTSNVSFIGGWLIFKTVHRLNYQKINRGMYNRYLLSNILLLAISYCLALWLDC